MSELRVSGIEREANGDGGVLSAQFRLGRRSRRVWLHSSGAPVTGLADPFLAIGLPVAMSRHVTLSIDGPVSARLLRGANEIQRVLSGWYPALREIQVAAGSAAEGATTSSQPGVAAFFSGGVDSFDTLRRHRDELTHLIFVHGFDLALRRHAARERASGAAREVAGQLGLGLVEVGTNLREFAQPHVSWPQAYFGAALGAIALLLSPGFRRVYVPGGISQDHLVPEGSHPELDPHWSNDATQVVHDGVESDRFSKILSLADWPLAREHLRVCYQARAQGGNCGRCIKCVWTMQVLAAAGVLQHFRTFPARLDPGLLRRYPVTQEHQRARFEKGLALLRERGDAPELQSVLAEMLRPDYQPPLTARAGRWLARVRNYLEHRLPSSERPA